jgi:hypothetical protein
MKITYLREDGRENLDFLTERGNVVLPVQEHRSLADHGDEVHRSVGLAEAVVRTSTEHEPVLDLLLSVTSDPSLRIEGVRVGVGLRIVESKVGRGNDHGTLRRSVLGGDGEVLLGKVGNHDHRGTVTESLLDNRTGISHLFEDIHGEGHVAITATDTQVLLTNPIQHLRLVGAELEQPGGSGGGGILRSEEEGEESHGDLEIGELTDEHVRLLRRVDLNTVGNLLTVGLGIVHLLNPSIENALNLATSGHADLALSGTLSELNQNHISSLLAIPSLGEGNDDGEVDKLHGLGDQVVIVGDLLDSGIRHVVSDEGTARDSAHDLTEGRHERLGLAIVGLGHLKPLGEVLPVHLLLAREVDFEGATGEQAVQTLAVVDMRAAVEEDPVGRAEQLVSGIDDARLDKRRRIEDLAGDITGRRNDDKPITGQSATGFDRGRTGRDILVEDGDTAEVTAEPLVVILLEFRVDRLQERSDEGSLPRGSGNRALVVDVLDCSAVSFWAGVTMQLVDDVH